MANNRPIKKLWEIYSEIKIWWTPSREKKEYFWWWFPWVSIRDMDNNKHITETKETLSELGVKHSNVKLIKSGSLLFSFKLTVGRMAFAGCDLYTNEAIACFEPNENIDLIYLYYILPYIANQVDRTNNYWAPLLNKSVIANLKIPLPPIDIQKAIVSKLDEVFSSIDESIALTQANITQVDEVNQSALNKIFEEDWETKKLCDVCIIDPKKALINSVAEETEVSFVPMADMEQEEMYFKSKQTRKIGDVRKWYTYFEDDDVLLAKVTPCFENGKSGIAKNLKNGIWFGSSEYIVLRKNKDILSKYIYYIVSSKKFRKEWAKNMSGAVWLQRIKKERLHNYLIPLPPVNKQQQIVEHLDNVFSHSKQIKSEYEVKLLRLKELKASILQSAFEGKLL